LAAGVAAPPNYRHRLRYYRRGNQFHIWLRVLQVDGATGDVPFTWRLSTDSASQNVILEKTHVARAQASHVTRAVLDLAELGWTQGSPLYSRVVFTGANTSTRIRQLNRR
jgi:hypothetical protein